MKKKNVIFSCVAVAAIAAFVGMKTLGLHADESNSLLKQNVEALSEDEYAIVGKTSVRTMNPCLAYLNGVLTAGYLGECKSADPTALCVPGLCMVGE